MTLASPAVPSLDEAFGHPGRIASVAGAVLATRAASARVAR